MHDFLYVNDPKINKLSPLKLKVYTSKIYELSSYRNDQLVSIVYGKNPCRIPRTTWNPEYKHIFQQKIISLT
jgi:hypothetical protein